MTGKDALNQFDLLYNNIDSNQSPGLEPIEISYFLTKAEEELVKNYFNSKSNPKQEGYNYSPKRDSDFRTLVSTMNINIDENEGYYSKNVDILFPLYETYKKKGTTREYIITPITAEEYARILTKPYPYPPKNMIWKVYIDSNKFKLITTIQGIDDIALTYIKNVTPIGADFYTVSDSTWCELPEHLHPELIQRAVEIAKGVWQGDINSVLQLGQRSE